MKTFNFNQSLTRVINNVTFLPFRKGLGLGRLLILCLALATFGVGNAWGKTWYATAYVEAVPQKGGYVKVISKGATYIDENVKEGDINSATSSITNSQWNLSSSSGDVDFSAYAKSKSGYTFMGWATSSSATSGDKGNTDHYYRYTFSVTSKSTSSPGASVYRYAIFTPNTYTITFDKQNGTDGSNSVTATYDADMPTATAPTRTGYDFAGYYDATSGGTQYYTANMASAKTWDKTSATTLYARWTAHKYTITFNGNGATSGSMSNQPYTYDVDQNLSANNFSRNYTITYDANGGTCSVAPASMTASFLGWATTPTGGKEYDDKQLIHNLTSTNNQTINLYAVWGDATTSAILPTATKDNSVIEGWYDGDDFVGEPGESYTPKQNVTLIAHWINKYDIVVNGSDQSMKVDGTQDNAFTFVHAENPTTKITIVSIDQINNGDGQVIEYDAANNKIIAHNAGTATIYFEQAETSTMYESVSASFTYTVTKHDNHISINGSQDSYQTSIYMDSYAQIDLTATNTDYAGSPISNNQTTGTDIATFYQNDNVVYSTYNLGDATWTVSQPENYKYNAANATFTIHVVKQAEATDCYVLNDAKERSWSTISNSGSYGPFDAAGTTLLFEAERTALLGFSNTTEFYAQYSSDGSNWTNCLTINLENKDQWYPLSCSIPETAKYVRFETKVDATGYKHICNVRVTRATYLNASDFTINTQSDNTTLIYPGKTGTGSFHVDYSLANGDDLKIVCDNPKFTIDKTTQTNVDCKSGSFDVNMTYTSQTAGTDYAHVVIYNNVYRKEITVTGITQKHQQTLKWKDNFDQMSLGQEVNDAASSSHGAVTYTSDKPDIIRVDNGTTLIAVAKGDAKITATAAGDDEYAEISIEKTISVTEKCVQYIVWTQSLMGLKLGDPNRTLNAYATSEIEECTSNNGGRLVTYTSADESVVKVVNTNELQIVGVGTTTVTAHQAGGLDSDDHEYEPATKENTVVVKDPSAKCEAFVYEQNGDAEQFFKGTLDEITGTEHTLSGEPAKITFRAKREYWNLAINYSKGNIVLDAYTPTGGWQQVLDCGEPPIGSYQEYSKELSRDVTKIRFRRPKGGQGYHYIADAKVEMLRYIETSTPSTFQANVGEQQQQTIYLSYSNITSDLLLSMASGASSHFSVDKTQITGDCGAVAKNVALTISYAPTTNTEALGEETETLIISDGTTTTNVALKGTANRVARSIVWNIDDKNTAYTVQTVNLNATAETNLQQAAGKVAFNIVSQSSTEGCGSINNNVLSFAKAGNVSVVATTIEDAKYLPAVAVTKSWTVNITPTEIVTNPEIDGEIVYGAQLSDLQLKANTGAARNTVNQQSVEGTFSITDGDISSAGEKTITVTFTPANTDMYASCTKDITVTVQKAQPDAHAHASDIIYGAAVQTSILTNEGSTEGTWSWTDEKKGQVLNVGTHEGFAVHFTPTDKTNYNEIDGTVSLTITAVTPELTWTAKPETAQVHEVKTFTASSTNTDNTAAITYSITDGIDCASINVSTGEVTMLKAGTITVQASQAATTNFNAATSITTTCTISKAPTKITTAPTVGDIVSGTAMSAIVLQGGEAQNTITNEAVEGTFAVTAGDLINVGEKTLTVTFTPNNTDMYEGCTTTITTNIIQREATAEEVGTPSAASITYGNAINTSVLSGTGTLAGEWTWVDEDANKVIPNAGTVNNLNVIFTPVDNNVKTVAAVVSLTVNKVQTTITWTSETTFEWGEIDNYFVADNEGTVVMSSLDESIATIQDNKIIPVKAGTVTIQGDIAESDNYQSATLIQTITINAPSENKFTNAAGDNDWNNPTNWSAGLVPDKTDEANIVVSGELNIEEEVVVGSLTIEDGGSVNVLHDGDLTIQSESGIADQYGDLYVKNGGDVTLNGTLKVHDFVIESSIGTADGSSKSGQITNAEMLQFNDGDAYIDINLDPSGSVDDAQWYGFTVPFEVDIATGIYRKESNGSFKQLKDKTNFDIMQYNPAKRLTTGKGWEYNHGVLHPGEFYFLGIDGTNNIYRFRKKAGAGFTTEAQVELHTNGEVGNPNANWNPVGNPCLRHTTTDYEGFVQVYKNGKSAYLTVPANEVTYVVGCPFFVQAQEEGSLMLETSDATEGQFYAPRRMATNNTKNQIQLLTNQGKVEDQIFIMASEDASLDYEAGSDLLKAGVSTRCGQMWLNAYGEQLSVQAAPIQENKAIYYMSLYAPKVGDYMLHVNSSDESAEIYLISDGAIIWNLSEGDYPISLSKGTTNKYGLVFQRTQQDISTDASSPLESKMVDKIIHHEQMFIFHKGQLYNAIGTKVK